ncbi:hypothetical protein CRUP_017757 [Coryphaenoides rupestris]|nr:hypothetical protein CRUP_017757 [Coryphaenoides rupestris]
MWIGEAEEEDVDEEEVKEDEEEEVVEEEEEGRKRRRKRRRMIPEEVKVKASGGRVAGAGRREEAAWGEEGEGRRSSDMVPLGADRCGHLRRSGPGTGGSQEFISVNQTNGFTADPIPLQSPGSPSPESHYVAPHFFCFSVSTTSARLPLRRSGVPNAEALSRSPRSRATSSAATAGLRAATKAVSGTRTRAGTAGAGSGPAAVPPRAPGPGRLPLAPGREAEGECVADGVESACCWEWSSLGLISWQEFRAQQPRQVSEAMALGSCGSLDYFRAPAVVFTTGPTSGRALRPHAHMNATSGQMERIERKENTTWYGNQNFFCFSVSTTSARLPLRRSGVPNAEALSRSPRSRATSSAATAGLYYTAKSSHL